MTEPVTLASHGRRLAAYGLDAALFAATAVVGGVLGAVVRGVLASGREPDPESDGEWEELEVLVSGVLGGMAVGALVALVAAVWFVRRSGAHNGQTPGKQLLRIRAVRADLRPVGLGVALLRELVGKGVLAIVLTAVVITLFGLLGSRQIGLFAAAAAIYAPVLADQQRRAVHDWLARTRVVTAGR